MSRITNCENLSATLVGLLILAILVTGSVGCASQVSGQLSSDDTNVFLPDRVAEVRIVMKEELWNDLQSNAKEEEYYLVDLWFDGELVPDVAVRAKGSSSLVYVVKDGSNRLSLKVDINLFNDMRTFHGLKKLNYHNCYRDPTLMREKLAYDLFAQMGVPASRTSHVDLWVNDTHLGLYLQVEQVDKAFLRRHFPQNCEGNLYKPIPPASFLNWAKGDIEETQTDLESDPNDINIGGGNLSDIVGALGHGQTTGSPTVSTATPSGSTDATVSNEFSYLRRMRLKTNEKRA
ncbi:MAG: CotH kinase family protein, partial [Chloroflexota bacterium]|nr:CotH kinase family protein [Chloroflexota bacterium]